MTRLLILGTGSMAAQHAKHFAQIPGVTLAGAVDVVPDRAEAFAHEHQIPMAFSSLDAALAWNAFDAAANVTPDREHYPTTMKLLDANKHVFCEKPLAVTHEHADEMTETAERRGLVAMVNLTYRNVAALQAARRFVLSGHIGAVKHIEAAYLQSWLSGHHWGDWRQEERWLWRLSEAHGSQGVLGDVGVHILDFASFGANLDVSRLFCRLKTFDKAEGGTIGSYKLDANDSFTMNVEFGNGALGLIHASRWATGYANTLRLSIFGDAGAIEIEHGMQTTTLRICAGADIHTQSWRTITPEPVVTNYENFITAVREGRTYEPSFRRAAQLQRLIDLGFSTEQGRCETAVLTGG